MKKTLGEGFAQFHLAAVSPWNRLCWVRKRSATYAWFPARTAVAGVISKPGVGWAPVIRAYLPVQSSFNELNIGAVLPVVTSGVACLPVYEIDIRPSSQEALLKIH
jgi:hypothetical protein